MAAVFKKYDMKSMRKRIQEQIDAEKAAREKMEKHFATLKKHSEAVKKKKT